MKNKFLNRQFKLLLKPDEMEKLAKNKFLSIIDKSYALILLNALIPLFSVAWVGTGFMEKIISFGLSSLVAVLTALGTFLLILWVDRLAHRHVGFNPGVVLCTHLNNKEKLETINKLESLKSSLDPILFNQLVALLNKEEVGEKWWHQLKHTLNDFEERHTREEFLKTRAKKKPSVQQEEDRFGEKLKGLTALALEHQKEKVLPSILSTEKLDVK